MIWMQGIISTFINSDRCCCCNGAPILFWHTLSHSIDWGSCKQRAWPCPYQSVFLGMTVTSLYSHRPHHGLKFQSKIRGTQLSSIFNNCIGPKHRAYLEKIKTNITYQGNSAAVWLYFHSQNVNMDNEFIPLPNPNCHCYSGTKTHKYTVSVLLWYLLTQTSFWSLRSQKEKAEK